MAEPAEICSAFMVFFMSVTIPGYSILIILLLKAFFFINNGFEIAGK